jgi:hypothetical protein
LPVFQARLQYK